jgi:GTP cyclohydrolase I
VVDRSNDVQHTQAHVTMSVNLPQHFKGTHMSRFIEVLNKHSKDMSVQALPTVLKELQEYLESESARIVLEFPYFVEKTAPVSGSKALMDYECSFTGEYDGKTSDIVIGVKVPVTSLCPCSKEISDYGAHNQRGIVDIKVRTLHDENEPPKLIWLEEIIQKAEDSASSPLYPLLKRTDERHVTMQAYDNPVFVEDLVRNVAMRLQNDERIKWFTAEVTNFESIHNHNAFALVEWTRP